MKKQGKTSKPGKVFAHSAVKKSGKSKLGMRSKGKSMPAKGGSKRAPTAKAKPGKQLTVVSAHGGKKSRPSYEAVRQQVFGLGGK